MALQAGQRVGSFEIIGPLGRGGMGEVYRARDTRLQRDVAVKVLSEAHASNPDRIARFRRESVVLASLLHPNIATLFAVEESGPVKMLVMEVVTGDTLADYIARHADRPRGRGLARADALQIASQIATALEAAHAKGIVHRDLTPANIKVTPGGSVKVLDFGLASLRVPHDRADVPAAPMSTLTEGAMAVIGTPAYMSPEQARGDEVDRRADVWAFGCVLFEMLTGRRAFDGETTIGTLASVLEREPDLSTLPPDTPRPIRRLLRRALAKDPALRLRDIGDAQLEILESSGQFDDDSERGTPVPQNNRRVWLAASTAVLLAAILAGGSAWWVLRQAAPVAPVSRFEVAIPAGALMQAGGGLNRTIAISPDGSRIVFPSQRGFVIRHRDRLAFETLDIADFAATTPFFSPDGNWIGYLDDGRLMKVAVTGGSPVEVAKVSAGASATWGPGFFLVADVTGLYRIDQDGGVPERLPMMIGATEQVAFPEVMPDGRWVLVTVMATRTNTIGAGSVSLQARIDAFDLVSGAQKTVLRGGGRPTYVRTGHVLFGLNQTLRAIAFDPDRLVVRGQPVVMSTDPGSAEFSVSRDGTLVHVAGRDQFDDELVWVDRQGHEQPLGAPRGGYIYARLSPDGKRVALDVAGANRDVWVWDIPRRTFERFTIDPTENVIPTWSRDGKYLAFSSSLSGISNVYWQPADGSGQPERLWESERLHQPISFAPDGRLLISEAVPGRGRDVLALSLGPGRRLERILDGEATEGTAEVSPDGRWIAYDSDETGQFEIYVRPYPRTSLGRWRVSRAGGRQPLWARDGAELYFKDLTGSLMAAAVTRMPTFTTSAPTRLLDGAHYTGGGTQLSGRTYDLSADGSRFLMIKTDSPPAVSPLTLAVTENWFGELRAKVPGR